MSSPSFGDEEETPNSNYRGIDYPLDPQNRNIVFATNQARDMVYQAQLTRRSFQINLDKLQRDDLTKEEILLQTQLTTQLRVFAEA
ncbi:unnamed protein product [Mucor hiemalis]